MGCINLSKQDVGIVLQARMGSTRLPGKILLPLNGPCILERIIEKINSINLKHILIVATTTDPSDDVVEKFCSSLKVKVFRGNQYDVLDRYYRCALQFNFQHIIRLTGDNPFLDEFRMLELTEKHLKNNFDYSNNFESLPLGVGCEVFSFTALQESFVLGKEKHHREHVNEYILENSSKFNFFIDDSKKIHPNLRLTIDTQADYDRAKNIFVKTNKSNPSLQEILAVI